MQADAKGIKSRHPNPVLHPNPNFREKRHIWSHLHCQGLLKKYNRQCEVFFTTIEAPRFYSVVFCESLRYRTIYQVLVYKKYLFGWRVFTGVGGYSKFYSIKVEFTVLSNETCACSQNFKAVHFHAMTHRYGRVAVTPDIVPWKWDQSASQAHGAAELASSVSRLISKRPQIRLFSSAKLREFF